MSKNGMKAYFPLYFLEFLAKDFAPISTKMGPYPFEPLPIPSSGVIFLKERFIVEF